MDKLNKFMLFFNQAIKTLPLTLKINYTPMWGWWVRIVIAGRENENKYPKSRRLVVGSLLVVDATDKDMEVCFTKAHTELQGWIANNVSYADDIAKFMEMDGG